MREAIESYVGGLREEGYPVPAPETSSAYVEVTT